jgi:hypothetical protein
MCGCERVLVASFPDHPSFFLIIQYLLWSGLPISTTGFQELAQAGQSSLTIILDNLDMSQNAL